MKAMPESTMHCHLCRTKMPARVLAEHLARQHPDPDHQVEWVDGTPGPVLVDLTPGPQRYITPAAIIQSWTREGR